MRRVTYSTFKCNDLVHIKLIFAAFPLSCNQQQGQQRDSFCQAKSLAIAGTLASFSSSVFFKCCGSSCRCFFVISLGLLMHTTDVRALCLKSTFLLMANRWCLGVKENYSLALTCSVTRRLSSH